MAKIVQGLRRRQRPDVLILRKHRAPRGVLAAPPVMVNNSRALSAREADLGRTRNLCVELLVLCARCLCLPYPLYHPALEPTWHTGQIGGALVPNSGRGVCSNVNVNQTYRSLMLGREDEHITTTAAIVHSGESEVAIRNSIFPDEREAAR